MTIINFSPYDYILRHFNFRMTKHAPLYLSFNNDDYDGKNDNDNNNQLTTNTHSESGAFSQVYMAKSRQDPDDIVAIKCIDKRALRGKEDSLENEIRVLRK